MQPSHSGRQPSVPGAARKTQPIAPAGGVGPSGRQKAVRQTQPLPPSGRMGAERPSARLPAHGERAATRSGAAPRGARTTRPRMALKLKFMLVMAAVTAVAMVVLGLSMGRTANAYLYGQKTLDGIELARMAAQIGYAAKDRWAQIGELGKALNDPRTVQALREAIRADVERYLRQAVTWGGEGYTDVEAVLFDCPDIAELSSAGIGNDQGTSKGPRVTEVFVPKMDRTIAVPEGITIYEGRKTTKSGEVSILRFKIALDPDPPPRGFGRVRNADNQLEPANVRVDIAMASVDKVRSNLALTIGIAVVVAIAVVIGIAIWLASSITRPLEVLLKDMQVVSKGNLAHRTSARSNDEIGILAQEFNKMTESLQEAQAAVIEQEKAAYELSLAREVQQHLLPAQPPIISGWQCQSFYQGAKAVSGDYFDFIPLGGGLWGFIIADVSGKGIPGSMMMAVTRTVVRLIAPRHGAAADETLKETNRLIAKQIKRGMFVTALYAVLNEATGVITYASAGHNPMVIYRAATRSHELSTAKGIALGFNEGPIFDRTIQRAEIALQRGDAIVLYTDGFPEAMNARGEEFGEERFYQLICANGHLAAPAMVEAMVAGIAAHRGDAEQSDDLTLLVVKRA